MFLFFLIKIPYCLIPAHLILNQASNLINSLGVIKTKIDNATQEISNQSRTAINNTVESYSDTEGRVSQAFSSEG